ncbi:hypothetical protein [Halalkaliarchaeum desulfuricum]|uniref:hypothetical protein n=1 Tax=Halalkaliarchaeum desulfuricum TaxID=2055893 RepID=UPI001FED01BA|nr:hypothetical protein [Halalkaliarchaeum desulfuricum]
MEQMESVWSIEVALLVGVVAIGCEEMGDGGVEIAFTEPDVSVFRERITYLIIRYGIVYGP